MDGWRMDGAAVLLFFSLSFFFFPLEDAAIACDTRQGTRRLISGGMGLVWVVHAQLLLLCENTNADGMGWDGMGRILVVRLVSHIIVIIIIIIIITSETRRSPTVYNLNHASFVVPESRVGTAPHYYSTYLRCVGTYSGMFQQT